MGRLPDEPVPVLSYEVAAERDHFPWVVHFVGIVLAVLAGFELLGVLSQGFRTAYALVAIAFMFSLAGAFLFRRPAWWALAAVVLGTWNITSVVIVPSGRLAVSGAWGAGEFVHLARSTIGYILGFHLIAVARRMATPLRARDAIEQRIWRAWVRFRGTAIGFRGRLQAVRDRHLRAAHPPHPLRPAIIYVAILPVLNYLRLQPYLGDSQWRYYLADALMYWVAAGGLWWIERHRTRALELLVRSMGWVLVTALTGFAVHFANAWSLVPDLPWSVYVSCALIAAAGALLAAGRARALPLAIAGVSFQPVVHFAEYYSVRGEWAGAVWILANALPIAGVLAYLWIYVLKHGTGRGRSPRPS